MITIVGVTKGRSLEQAKEAIGVGITDIGENRVQEARVKYGQLRISIPNPGVIKWHMIGHLQTNKVKEAVKIFDLIHSVDSLRLALEIDKEAGKINKMQGVLFEINTSGEVSKYGLKPEDASGIIKEIEGAKNLEIKGLMTIAPIADSPEKSRPYFRVLKELCNKINAENKTKELKVLSMGMTDDFEVAIEEGSTMVRLGRAIFGG